VAPTNLNVVIRIDSPGNDGPVTQTNTSVASATGNNSNATAQDAAQNQTGGGPSGGQSQSADQTAPTTQSANATAASYQAAPRNANIVIRNKSPGDSGAVTQTNSSQATAQAVNGNAANQSADQTQTQTGAGSSGGQAQSISQSAPTTQDANGIATSTQTLPTNSNAVVLIDGAAPDPAGSGARGLWIQIWIPVDGQQTATQANTSSATASAGNTNHVTQSATQLQSGGSGGGSQPGGGGQSQTIVQSAPTAQNASAQATSEQGAGSGTSSASTTQTSSNQTAQSAQQTGSGIQVIEQSAPCTQFAGVTSASWGRDGWRLAASVGVGAPTWSAPSRPRAESPSPSRRSHARGEHRVPSPHAPKLPSASLGGTSGTDGSTGAFAVLLLAFALTAPWWARRHLPSALRRLMAVVSRLERPG
jgi:epidermal growth factor receptor substrate 15